MYNTKRNRNEDAGKMFVVGAIALFVIAAIILGLFYITVVPNYNKTVHGYMENARYSDNPLVMKENLILAEQGMKSLGLSNDTYSSVYPWAQTPSNRMSVQYQQIEIQIDRCEQLSHMNVTDYNYQSTLTSIQSWIYDKNGWGDDIAQGAYLYNMNIIYLFVAGMLAALAILVLLIVMLLG